MEQALYYELVFICNEWHWVDRFPCSNKLLAARLKVSERSIQRMRKSLLACGLISYRSRKFLKLSGVYSLTKNLVTGADLPMHADFSLLAVEKLEECRVDNEFMSSKGLGGERSYEAGDKTEDRTSDKVSDRVSDKVSDTGITRENTSESYLYKTKTKTKTKTKAKRARECVFKKQFKTSASAFLAITRAFKMKVRLLRCRGGPLIRIVLYW